jgi:hypothetical protein
MINQNLVNYIKSQLAKKVSVEKIKKDLLDVGWLETDIDQAINMVISQNNVSDSSSYNKPIKKNSLILWILIVLIILGVGGTLIYLNFFRKSTTKKVSSPISGLVNKNEIGCKGTDIFVISAQSGQSPIDNNGNYTATFSSEAAQLVMLINNQEELCATAISLPKYQNKVSFDAKSTAKTYVFQSIGILETEPVEAERRLGIIENLSTFSAFYTYIKNNLPNSNLNNFQNDQTFSTLLEACIKEMAQKLGNSY